MQSIGGMANSSDFLYYCPMASTMRTRFAKEIVAEFLPPARFAGARATRARKTKRQKVVIFCQGAPGIPGKRAFVEFLSKKGFWAFYPRYRGTWESDGVFMKKSLDQDVLDIIDGLPKGFLDLATSRKYKVAADDIFIIAGSFGGPAGILASRDPRVKKVVAISPVVEWLAPSKAEPMDFFMKFMKEAFGNGYRFGKKEEAKLRSGKFYSPMRHMKEIDGSKLLIFHAKDDDSVRWNEVVEFARETNATLKFFKKGGHLSSVRIVPKYWKQIAKFFAEK
jgi:dipeptidyl aminopeptidase/acylaminoacyl peptidase